METSRPKTAVAPPAGSCPWLVYYHGKNYKHQTFCCNITGRPSTVKTYRKKITALVHKEVLSCSHGWLVLYDDKTKLLSLCNSTTFDTTIALPNSDKLWSPYNYKIDSCVLLSSSPNNTLRDLQVVIFFEKVSSMMFLRLDDQEWREIGYGHQLKTIIDEQTHKKLTESGPLFFSGAVSCGRKIYAKLNLNKFCSYHFIWSIELVGEEEEVVLSRLDEPGLTEPHLCCKRVFVLESYGDLFLLRITQIEMIEVYRLKFDGVIWEKVKIVENRAFFIGNRYSLSCPAPGCGRIYYTKSEDQSLYCYNMTNDSESVSLPRPNLSTPWLSPIWIMPQAFVRPKDDDCSQDSNQGGSGTTTATFELLDENTKSDDFGLKQLSNLPFDALVQVSKNLAPLDYMNFRAASRICRSAIPPVKWRNPLFGSELSFAIPFLMSADYKNDQRLYKFVDPRLNNKCNTYLMKIPNSLEDSAIRYSNGGWVLTSKVSAIDLYNTFTGEVISVISTDDGSVRWNHSLFFTPTPGGGFLVIRIIFWGEEVQVFTIVSGEERWTYHDVDLKSNKGFKGAHSGPALFEDAFYYLDRKGNLGKFEIVDVDEEYYDVSWELLQKPLTPCNKAFDECFLVESDGDLLSVFVGNVGKWVSVYRLNRSKMVWETLASLGNYALFLSRGSSISVQTSSDLGNRIYFPSFRDSGIAFFSLETGEWHFSGSGDSSRDLYGTKLHRNCCWIKPI